LRRFVNAATEDDEEDERADDEVVVDADEQEDEDEDKDGEVEAPTDPPGRTICRYSCRMLALMKKGRKLFASPRSLSAFIPKKRSSFLVPSRMLRER
jgi:hypothetical protein